VQSNFHDYQVLRLNEVPTIDVHVVKSTEAPGGMGEIGAAVSAPAVVNAVFAATGKRLRRLPMEADMLKT
jgi:CO/xanthine dehydrogenase Mo-binding subunit